MRVVAKDIAFAFDATAKDLVKVSNAVTPKKVTTKAGTSIEVVPPANITLSIENVDIKNDTSILEVPPVKKQLTKEKVFALIEEVENQEPTITYQRQNRSIMDTESLENVSLKEYVINLNNMEFPEDEYDVILRRVMNYIIPNDKSKTKSSNIFSRFVFDYTEVDASERLNNSLRDYLLTPKFSYGVNGASNGFRTLREAVSAYQEVLYYGAYISSFSTELFRDINKILFLSQSALINGLSNDRVPLTYSFLRINKDNKIFDDSRDMILLQTLNNNFQQLTVYEKASYLDILTKGVLNAIHEEHRENIEKLKKQFTEDLGAAGLSLIDISQFDFSSVNWSDLFSDPKSSLYNLTDATKAGLAAYFGGVKDCFSQLFTTSNNLLESLTFNISEYPDDYLIYEEICKWLNYAGSSSFEDYEDSRLLYFVRILAAFLNSAEDPNDQLDFSRLDAVDSRYMLDVKRLRDNYSNMIYAINHDEHLTKYKDYFSGPVYFIKSKNS